MMADGTPHRPALQRGRSNFLTRTATDDAAQLARRYSMGVSAEEDTPSQPRESGLSDNPYEPVTHASQAPPRRHELTKKIFGRFYDDTNNSKPERKRSISGRRKTLLADTSLTAQMHKAADDQNKVERTLPRVGSMPRPVGGSEKLGTFSGVFVPTSLNVLSILMFIRFGFILGQSGVLGFMGEVFNLSC